MFAYLKKKKSWRKLKDRKRKWIFQAVRFRVVLMAVLILEGAYGLQGMLKLQDIQQRSEIVVLPPWADPTETMSDEWAIFGLRFRWSDGRLDVYRCEERYIDINTYN